VDLMKIMHSEKFHLFNVLANAVPLEAWTSSEGSRRLGLPYFKSIGKWRL